MRYQGGGGYVPSWVYILPTHPGMLASLGTPPSLHGEPGHGTCSRRWAGVPR